MVLTIVACHLLLWFSLLMAALFGSSARLLLPIGRELFLFVAGQVISHRLFQFQNPLEIFLPKIFRCRKSLEQILFHHSSSRSVRHTWGPFILFLGLFVLQSLSQQGLSQKSSISKQINMHRKSGHK